MRLNDFDFDIKYKKDLFNTQADAISRLRSSGETTFPVGADIPTYSIQFYQSDAALNDFNGMNDHDDMLAVTTNTTSTFVPVILEMLYIAQRGDKFNRTIQAGLGKKRGFRLRIKKILSCFAPSTDWNRS